MCTRSFLLDISLGFKLGFFTAGDDINSAIGMVKLVLQLVRRLITQERVAPGETREAHM